MKQTMTQAEKGQRLMELHQQSGAFVIPNPWDCGTAKVLEGMGFRALATSSSASAFSAGVRDHQLTREQDLEAARRIAMAVDIPVSADLGKGFGDRPEEAAETVKLAAEIGLAGCSIEDFSNDRLQPIFEFDFAVERVKAAASAVKALGFPFVLTARAESFLHGGTDLAEVIARLQAYSKAGADVLFAPGLPTLEAIAEVCRSVDRPVNFMAGIPGKSFSVQELELAGVKRISLASSLHRAAMGGLLAAAREVQDSGTFEYLDRMPGLSELQSLAGI